MRTLRTRLMGLSVLAMAPLVLLGIASSLSACEECGGHGHSVSVGVPDRVPAFRDTEGDDPLKIIVVGDTQSATGGGTEPFVPQLMNDIAARNPDFVLFPGDLVGTGSVSTFSAWNQLTSRFGDRRLMVPGNHDLPGRPATNQNWQAAFPWLPISPTVPNVLTDDPTDTIKGIDRMDYFIDLAPNVRLISVTTDRDLVPGESPTHTGGFEILGGEPRALDWFQSVMALPSTQDKDHVFVMTHHPVTSQMSQLNSTIPLTEGTATDWWQSIAGTHPRHGGASADALFAGHIHSYYPNRPDPHADTAELIVGTGGGGSEGVPHRQVHGFLEMTIDQGNIATAFIGDANDAVGGWSFTDRLDEFLLLEQGRVPTGELARYRFEPGAANFDSSTSALSKGHSLHFAAGVGRVDDSVRGSVVQFDGGGLIDAKNVGDHNFQVLGDLRIQLWAKATGDLGSDPLDNVLVAFGGADGVQTTSGTFDAATWDEEIANYAYQLSLTADGHLRLGWEHHLSAIADAPATGEFVVSTEAIANPHDWNQIEVLRDADQGSVRFLVNGQPLGEDQPIFDLPTGAGAGSLYFGGIPDQAPDGITPLADFVGRLDDIVLSTDSIELPPIVWGDINGDGVVAGDGTGPLEVDDVTAFAAGWLTDTTDFSNGEKLRHGDLNGDGITNLPDWTILNELLGNTDRGLLLVPEPHAVWLVSWIGCVVLRKRYRHMSPS